ILMPLADFDAGDAEALYAGAGSVDWSEHLDPGRTLAVDFSGIRPAVAHGRYAEQRVKDAVVDQFRERTGERPSVDTRDPDVRINVHMNGEHVQVALDLSGDSLHKRGVREAGTPAPLKENLAAAMLLRADWPEVAAAGGGFVDPMCGSGTLLIEAAWMASDTAPGLLRTSFGFLGWAGHDEEAWKELVDHALERQESGLERLPPIVGYDRDASAVRLAIENVRRAGLTGHVHVERRELGRAEPPSGAERGLVAVNPPYGERIGDRHELVPLYLRLGDALTRRFGGWRAMILNGSDCQVGLKPEKTWRMDNGPIVCRLERFEIVASEERDADAGGPGPAEDFVNRLAKNRRHLAKWLRREDITCYRVYDADIPEYALAVDVYGTAGGDWLHVQEYAPPSSVDTGKAQARLRAALSALPAALDVDPSRMVYKVRRRQKGAEQYGRQGERSQMLEVREGRCRLLVNLTDYLDTGLFLDHRPVRAWIGEQAAGKRFLNLFCYTGAATVHAAVGGATSTTSVDLSNTYLNWLGRNLERNDVNRREHHRVQADCSAWLEECEERFDLVFLDPPSFSNSKRMEGSLDVQRDHAAMIRSAMRVLAPGGTLVFSTNLRRFELDADLADEFDITDRTAWSIPKDFERSAGIHRCWFVRHGGEGSA
ncbi:MAG: bifunctional 23S rRNA (guanine(2069)-N(7))-methyltransferase RlmK/23S rRNA (guanine(2445)-N(2))-methyltransferase RlmL, partial [Wenzhouxiangellaceae bacterium]|nr:bifunctional 23S rRNA (guanine(2069)-N(7))-methyltransferase RlmK/23S rRNA (guanine(2445)-N(2))-methyltransferase RlmL [Wenzhouxiangellaceae bacterium]